MAAKKKVASAKDDENGGKFADTPTGQYKRWTVEFAQAKKFHRKWKERGRVAVKQYLLEEGSNDDGSTNRHELALFSANINTLMSMLYGRIPQVSVDRRWADPDDQLARVAAELSERLLNADIEEQGEDFSSVLRMCLQDRLLPGLGCARVRYNFQESEETVEQGDEPEVQKEDEWIEDVYVPWEDILWSPARYWSELRWIAFKLYKDKDEVKKFLGGTDKGDTLAEQLEYVNKVPTDNKEDQITESWNKAVIWEIWDKTKRCCYWYAEGANVILKKVDDPLELDGFFPCPPFFIANTTTKKYVPKSDYSFAEALYREVDLLEERICLLTSAVKVVGVYDKKAGQDVGRLVNETAENTLIPVDSWAAFQERGGIKGAIEFLPIEEIASVIETLQAQQQQRVQQLYQITGMADIMRGQSEGDRTSATEQQIKVKFASVRVQSIQDEFTRFATDMQKLRFEIICKHFDAATIIKHSNLQNTADAQVAMQAAQLLKDTEVTKWRIQIQPESMAMVDYAQLKQERTEYINSLGIFFQSALPVAEKFPEAGPILMELLKWGLAGFKGSKQIEGVIDRAMAAMQKDAAQKAGQPKPPTPEEQKAQAEMKRDDNKNQLELQQMQQEFQLKMQEQQQQADLKMKEMQIEFTKEMATIRMEMQQSQQRHAHETTMANMTHQNEQQSIQAQMEQRRHDAAATVVENQSQPPAAPGAGNA